MRSTPDLLMVRRSLDDTPGHDAVIYVRPPLPGSPVPIRREIRQLCRRILIRTFRGKHQK
jgi:hypothetical protein